MNLANANAALFAAIALAQGEVENATKNSANAAFRKDGKPTYADLAEVLNTVRPVFSRHGLAIIQSTESDGNTVSVTTTLAHKEGGYVSSTASCIPAKWDGQGVGAATTYLRRYSLAAMACIAQADDDGNAASHNRQPPRKVEPPSETLAAVLNGIAAAQTLDELNAIKPTIRTLDKAEQDRAFQAGTARKAAIVGGAA
jgi:hypothetical protein